MSSINLSEYHCCIGLKNEDDTTWNKLLSFIQTNENCVYTNIGFEYTPVKGHHIHIGIIFIEGYTEYWYKQLSKLRKELNYIKKCPKHPDALGWYWKPASTANNLAYIMKPETKTKENLEWIRTPISEAIKEKLKVYVSKSLQEVERHHRTKNNHYSQIKEYFIEKKVDMNDKRSIGLHLFRCYRETLDKLLPTRIQYEQLINTLQYDLNPSSIDQIIDHYNTFL